MTSARRSIAGSLAPSFASLPLPLVGRPPDQSQAIEIDYIPIMPMHPEGQPLLVPHAVDQQRLSILDMVKNVEPQLIANSGADMTDEHSRADL